MRFDYYLFLALANGIQFITKYDPKIKYSCAMNGQSVQIKPKKKKQNKTFLTQHKVNFVLNELVVHKLILLYNY